jgi:hypothetical protein
MAVVLIKTTIILLRKSLLVSKGQQMPPKRRKYQIESVQITPAENATVKSVMDRLMGRTVQEELPSTNTQGSSTAQGSTTAQTTQGSLPDQSSSPAQTKLTTLRSPAAQTGKTARGTRPALSRQPAQTEIAPSRDYMKAANSIVREAIRHGLFRGKSKQLYDFLYSKTRGAIVPSLSARLRRSELMKGSSIGSTHTLRDNLIHLRAVGLVSWKAIHGEQDGNVYSVHLPEEARLPFDLDGNPVQVSSPDHSDHSESKPLRPLSAETAQSDQSSSQVESTPSGEAKTSSLRPEKTIDDDAALAGLFAEFKLATKELTGKDLSISESDRWREVAQVLVAELKIAASRTTVSSVPAFLAEHLRRRLWKFDKKQARAEGRELPDEAVSEPQGAIDTSSCPDCGGSGWWYPEGESKGVAKCKHERLTSEQGSVS